MKTVLVVDDDRVMTTILSVWLKRMGHAVLLEHDVPDAIKMLKTRVVDAIILDLDMPSGCGTEVIQRLKIFHRTESIPIVVLSASDDPEVTASVLASGADKFIVKPATSDQIGETLTHFFECQEQIERARQAKDVARMKQHEPTPIIHYKGSQIGLGALVRMGALKNFLRKAAH